MADGSIRVKTKIDNSGVEKDLQELNAQIDKGLGGETANKINRLSAQWEKLSARQSENNAKIREYKAELAELQDLRSLNIASGDKSDAILAGEQATQIGVLQSKLERAEANGKGLSASMEKVGVDANEINTQLSQTGKATKDISRNTKSIGTGINSGIGKLARYAGALFGIRSIYMGLRRLSSAWLASDAAGAKQVQANINHIKNSLASVLGPVITWITDKMMILFGYVQAILKGLFGWELSVGNTASSMGGVADNAGKAAGGLKDAEKEAKKLKKQMAGFDEMNVLTPQPDDSSSGGGGGGGAGGGAGISQAVMPEIQTPDISGILNIFEKLKADLKPFLDMMKNIDFEPMTKAFGNVKRAGKETANVLYNSFIRVMNETMGPFIKLMSEDIVPKGLNAVARVLDRMNPVLDNLLKNVIEPIFNWFMLSFVPVGLELVTSIFEALSGILTVVIESFNTFYDNFGKYIVWALGEAVLAIMEDLKTIFNEVIESVKFFLTKLEEGDPIATTLATAIGLVAAALVAWKFAMIGINAATAIFNAISPFGWVVIAVAAVTAAVLVLYKNWDKIKAFFIKTLDKIKQWFSDLGDKIKEVWNNLKEKTKEFINSIKTGFNDGIERIKQYFKTLWQYIVDRWNYLKSQTKELVNNMKKSFNNAVEKIKEFFAGLWNKTKEVFSNMKERASEIVANMKTKFWEGIENIKGFFGGLLSKVTGVWSDIKTKLKEFVSWVKTGFKNSMSSAFKGVVKVVSGIVDGLGKMFKKPLNIMIDGINTFLKGINKVKLPGWLPGKLGGAGFNIPTIPKLARGGIINRATLAEVGEGRHSEAVIPLDRDNAGIQQIADLISSQMQGGGNGEPIVVKLYLDGKQILETVENAKRDRDFRRNGGGSYSY